MTKPRKMCSNEAIKCMEKDARKFVYQKNASQTEFYSKKKKYSIPSWVLEFCSLNLHFMQIAETTYVFY